MTEVEQQETSTATLDIDWTRLAKPLAASARVFNSERGWTGTGWMRVRGATLGAEVLVHEQGEQQHDMALAAPRRPLAARDIDVRGEFAFIGATRFNALAVDVVMSLSAYVEISDLGPSAALIRTDTGQPVRGASFLIGSDDDREPVAVLCDAPEEPS